MEIVFEILFEVYIELMMLIVPEEKAASKWCRFLTVVVAVVTMAGIVALFIWGWVLLFEQGERKGLIPLCLAIVLSLAQIIAGCVLHKRSAEQ